MRGCGIWWSQHRIRVDATIRVTNTSAGPIDRVELNTIAARIGNIALDPVTVDGVAVKATRSDQTIVVPLGGILPMGGTTAIRVRFGATLHTNLSGSNWMFTKANGIIDLYRWLPWVSRRTTVRPAEPRRPVRHAVEPVGPRPDRHRPQAHLRDDRRADRR